MLRNATTPVCRQNHNYFVVIPHSQRVIDLNTKTRKICLTPVRRLEAPLWRQ
jgi:hypothetical protein